MKGDEKVASPAPGDSWTRPGAYVGALARKRSYRRAREEKPRTQPVSPQPWLSVPFAVILAALAVIAVAIMVVAFPGNHAQPKARKVIAHEQGVAPRGWFQEAQKQFHK